MVNIGNLAVGGSSDFSTAEVTIVDGDGGAYIALWSVLQDVSASFELAPNTIPTVLTSLDTELSSGSNSFEVIMYQGHAVLGCETALSTSGSVELIADLDGYAVYDITGDCTITIS